MIKQNIFIINFYSLYEILDENKEFIIFGLKYQNEEDFIKNCDLTEPKFVTYFKI